VKRNIQLGAYLITLLILTACGPTSDYSTAARLNNQGNKAFNAENYDEALEKYSTAKQENPDLAEPYYNSGNTLYRQGNLPSAEDQTKQAARTAERTENQELAQHSYYNLGNNYFQAQKFEDAIEAYKEALRLNPGDVDAKYNLELALKMLQEQQQQQQQAGGGGGQQPPPPDGEQQQQGQGGQGEQQQDQGQGGQQDQPGGGGGQSEPQEQAGGGQGQDQQERPNGGRGLTQQEAEQLLDALGQDSQTLQERLQEGFFAPGLPPAEDW
jgi:tetratricopeptide (TPR) repeat protein